MEARVRESIPQPPGWAYEPKWDGFRCVAWSDVARLDSRNERPLLRYFPELEPELRLLPTGTVLDGEVVVVVDGVTSFDALQLRIHPASSRVEMLSRETPARLVAFDVLALHGRDLRRVPFSERRQGLQQLVPGLGGRWHLTPSTTDIEVARRWFHEFEAAGCDGLVAKKLAGPYVAGKRDMVKIKHRRTVDCVVAGYRVHKDGDKLGSILLGLHDISGSLHFVGHCSGFTDHDRVELLNQFDSIRSVDSFGEEARRPGSQHRWSTERSQEWVPVEPGVVVEVSYDQITAGRFRHATRFLRWRPDKDAADCTTEQLARLEGPGFDEIVAVR